MRRVLRDRSRAPLFPRKFNRTKNNPMKNIIAITALLAAGTALANAEEWDVIKYWDGFSSSDYTPLYSAESDVSLSDSSLVLAANGRAVFDVSSYSINFSTNTYQFELELTDWTTATSGPTIAWGISNTNDTNGQLMAFGGRGTSVWGTSSNGSNMSGGDGNSLGTYQNLTGTLTITIGEGAIAVKFVDSSSIERSLINERSFTCSTTWFNC